MEKNARGVSAPVRETRRINNGLFILNGECRQRYLYVDILLVEASRSCCYIYLKDGTRFMVTRPLLALERELPWRLFARVHQGYLVNLLHVDAFFGTSVVRVGKRLIPVSKPYRKELAEVFNILEDTSKRLDKKGDKE